MKPYRILALAAALAFGLGSAALAASSPDVARARALLDKDKVDEAVAALEAAIARDQGDVEALIILSTLYRNSKMPDQALAQAQAAVRADPRHQEALLTRAMAWEEKGDVAKARADYDAALAIGPYAPAFHNRGRLAALAGDHERAVADFRATLQADPQAAESAFALGLELLELNRTEEALQAIDQAIAIAPDYRDAYVRKIRLLESADRLDEAGAVFPVMLKVFPKDAVLQVIYGGYWQKRGDGAKALAAFTLATRLDPGLAAGWWSRGVQLRDDGKYKQALESLDRALLLSPAEAEILIDRAMTRWDAGDERALADFDAALKIDPKSIYGLHARGRYLLASDEYDRALTDFDAIVGLDPAAGFAYAARADVYLVQERYDRALREINKALELERNADGLIRKGAIYRGMGDHLQSIEVYDEAIKLEPANAWAWSGRGKTKVAMGDAAGGEADRQQALKLDPSLGT